ncbi:hypothetical protein GE09DRAFT_602291 [Coniochaeta sp. 2T2.1]|nr:hypothetical protein GE09DRAFT_602291 [Coniochaeta sp. 2T2.1]
MSRNGKTSTPSTPSPSVIFIFCSTPPHFSMGQPDHHPLPPSPLPVSQRRRVSEPILRTLSLVLCLSLIPLQTSVILAYKAERARFGLDYPPAVDLAANLTPLVLITLFDTVQFVIELGLRQGCCWWQHPGLQVSLELVFWLACAWLRAANTGAARKLRRVGVYLREFIRVKGERAALELDGDARAYEELAIAARVVAWLFAVLMLARFTLFVTACVETHQRRKAKRAGQNPVVFTTQHDGEASIPLKTACDPVTPLYGPPQ